MDFDQFDRHLADLPGKIEQADHSEVLRSEVRPLISKSIGENFASSIAADGQAWPPRKKAGDGHPLLIETTALVQAATGSGPGAVVEISPNELVVGVDPGASTAGGIPGAAAHQFGSASRNIPARPYMEARDDALDQAAEKIADAALELVGGPR